MSKASEVRIFDRERSVEQWIVVTVKEWNAKWNAQGRQPVKNQQNSERDEPYTKANNSSNVIFMIKRLKLVV